MHSKDLPLPTAEEVLFCYSKTTAEEVRINFGILYFLYLLSCVDVFMMIIAVMQTYTIWVILFMSLSVIECVLYFCALHLYICKPSSNRRLGTC